MHDDEAPGWDAIESAFAARYGDQTPVHVAPHVQPPFAGGVLNGISAYRGERHWHFVTFGLTDLFHRSDDQDDISGWGYELTMTTALTDQPQPWVWETLLQIAATTVDRGTVYRPGVRFQTGMFPDPSSGLSGLAVGLDPLVTPTDFPLGRFELLHLIGITASERHAMAETSTDDIVRRLLGDDPTGRTLPTRASVV